MRVGLSKGVVVGFLAEASHYPNANTARLWSFGAMRLRKNTACEEGAGELICSVFYALNGASVYTANESAKKDAVIDFVEEVRKRNAGKRLVLSLDNVRAQTSWETREAAEALRIELVFLPPYSPDLTPIEFIGKSIKRALSALLLRWKEEVTCVVAALFRELAASLCFATSWIEQFWVL